MPVFQIHILENHNIVKVECILNNSTKESFQFDSKTIRKEFIEMDIANLKDYFRLGLDGISVFCLCKFKNEMNFFGYWSPEVSSVYNKLSLFVFSIAINHLKNVEIIKYLEHLNDYIRFMLPYKTEEFEDIQVFKIFGSLSWQSPSETDYPLQKRLEDSITKFSNSKPILLDLSNFKFMAFTYKEVFANLFEKYENIIILMNDAAIKTFNQFGFKKEYFLNKESAMDQIKRLENSN